LGEEWVEDRKLPFFAEVVPRGKVEGFLSLIAVPFQGEPARPGCGGIGIPGTKKALDCRLFVDNDSTSRRRCPEGASLYSLPAKLPAAFGNSFWFM